MEWYIRVLRKYAVFEGRAGRREFWMFTLWNLVFILAALIIDHAGGIDVVDLADVGLKGLTAGPVAIAYLLALFVPNLAVQCRRLHDIGRTGWLQLVALIPYIGTLILVIFCVQPGNAGPNKYGPVPDAKDPRAR